MCSTGQHYGTRASSALGKVLKVPSRVSWCRRADNQAHGSTVSSRNDSIQEGKTRVKMIKPSWACMPACNELLYRSMFRNLRAGVEAGSLTVRPSKRGRLRGGFLSVRRTAIRPLTIPHPAFGRMMCQGAWSCKPRAALCGTGHLRVSLGLEA